MGERGVLMVMSAPSGAGKRTLLEKVRERRPGVDTTVSATTRPPRPGEVDGVDYHFLDRGEFDRRVAAGEFVEWAEVHGNRYGTLHAELDRRLAAGRDLVLELDVQGMRSLKARRPDAVTVFLMPPSLEELERRLRRRGTEGEDVIALRLRNAREEMAARDEFDHVVVNDELDRAAAEMEAILRGARQPDNPDTGAKDDADTVQRG